MIVATEIFPFLSNKAIACLVYYISELRCYLNLPYYLNIGKYIFNGNSLTENTRVEILHYEDRYLSIIYFKVVKDKKKTRT